RKALPRPDSERPELQRAFVAPRTPLEEVLAGLYESVLGLQRVGVHDNFFTELGGHSLLATQVVSRIRETFQIDLPLRRIFESPTIADLSGALLETPRAGVSLERLAELVLSLSRMPEEEVERQLEADSLHP
ncbi:MAG TPA: phosphopantetheine-binding protein, partial [Chthoniobacteraceae bacterium]|nr:phosphopantetheine-binding protein [Chthoniobacteraceae bacterium]